MSLSHTDSDRVQLQNELDEYRKATEFLKSSIAGVDGMEQLLTGEAFQCADILAELAVLLGVKDTKVCNLFSGMQELQLDDEHKQLYRAQLHAEHAQLESKLSSMERELKELSDFHEAAVKKEAAEASDFERQYEETKMLEKKREEYRATARKCDKDLKDLGYAPELSHKALLQLAEQCKEKEEFVTGKEAQVQAYMGLPPDSYLAKQKLEQAKQELKTVSEVFDKLVKEMKLTLPT